MTTKIFANTLAKCNEGRLLSEERLRRLADADFESAVKMLLDYGFGDSRSADGVFDIDSLIKSETSRLIDFIEEECFDDDTKAVLLARYYYNNAKARYKLKIGASTSEDSVYAMENDPTRNIASGSYDELPAPMSEALKALDDKGLHAALKADEIDLMLSRAMFADMSAHAKKAGRAVKAYVTAKIDFVNLDSALRLLRREKDMSRLAESFINGGSLSLERIEEAYGSGVEGFAEALTDTVYFDVLKKVSDKGFEALAMFESESASLEGSFFDGDLENMLSSAPLLHYYAAAINEFRTVKTILTLIKNNAREEIPKRVRWS